VSGHDHETDRRKAAEKAFFEQYRTDDSPLSPVDVAEIQRTKLAPCHTTGDDRYSDNKRAFHQRILRDGGWENKYVLDYACGTGMWSIYFALTGARQVVGFDLAESGVRRGQELAQRQGLAGKVSLLVGDATRLPFPNDHFEIIIGTAVIHHVIKYPNVFEELHRVLKPGAKAYFLEGLADFPLFRLWWKLKGEVPQGDVPIFRRELLAKGRMFSQVEVMGDTFVGATKTFVWRKRMGPVRRGLLRAGAAADRGLFAVCPALRRWGCFSYSVFTK
jgi:SAM-dependent methyltransferase